MCGCMCVCLSVYKMEIGSTAFPSWYFPNMLIFIPLIATLNRMVVDGSYILYWKATSWMRLKKLPYLESGHWFIWMNQYCTTLLQFIIILSINMSNNFICLLLPYYVIEIKQIVRHDFYLNVICNSKIFFLNFLITDYIPSLNGNHLLYHIVCDIVACTISPAWGYCTSVWAPLH